MQVERNETSDPTLITILPDNRCPLLGSMVVRPKTFVCVPWTRLIGGGCVQFADRTIRLPAPLPCKLVGPIRAPTVAREQSGLYSRVARLES